MHRCGPSPILSNRTRRCLNMDPLGGAMMCLTRCDITTYPLLFLVMSTSFLDVGQTPGRYSGAGVILFGATHVGAQTKPVSTRYQTKRQLSNVIAGSAPGFTGFTRPLRSRVAPSRSPAANAVHAGNTLSSSLL